MFPGSLPSPCSHGHAVAFKTPFNDSQTAVSVKIRNLLTCFYSFDVLYLSVFLFCFFIFVCFYLAVLLDLGPLNDKYIFLFISILVSSIFLVVLMFRLRFTFFTYTFSHV